MQELRYAVQAIVAFFAPPARAAVFMVSLLLSIWSATHARQLHCSARNFARIHYQALARRKHYVKHHSLYCEAYLMAFRIH